MQVVLSTIGRFHTFDLARQLQKRNNLKIVFSGYPSFKLQKEGLPTNKIKTFPWLHGPFVRMNPQTPWVKKFWAWQDLIWFDRFVEANLPECDLFHALSGFALRSAKRAKKRGAKYICDRGSSHIRFQDQVLLEEYDRQGLPCSGIDPRVIEAEEAEYDLADAITVPSTFARDTFIGAGVRSQKVKALPYGVDLGRYHAVSAPPPNEFRILFAGTICVRKGIRYLLDAYEKLVHPGKKLFFAGAVEPRLEPLLSKLRGRQDIVFTGHLTQKQIIKVMSESHVLVLPSVEDGFGLVLAQAMACGCPIIASTNTGGPDLIDDGVEGFVVPIRSSDAIAGQLQRLADNPDLRALMSQRSVARVRSLGGWDWYGDAASEAFQQVQSR
jgi:alpha-maltose-1-phosphate synthase